MKKNLSKIAFDILNKRYIKSDCLDTVSGVKTLEKLGFVIEEGDVLKATNRLKDIYTLVKAFRIREEFVREHTSLCGWLFSISVGKKSREFIPIGFTPNLGHINSRSLQYIDKELQALIRRDSCLRSRHSLSSVKNEDECESRKGYRITVLGSMSRIFCSILQKFGLRLKPITCHRTEDIVNLFINGKVDVAFPVPKLRISEIREHIQHIHIIPVNLNVQTQVLIPLNKKLSDVNGFVSEYSTERALSMEVLNKSKHFGGKKCEFLDSFEDVVAKVSEGYAALVASTASVIYDNKLWRACECFIPLRSYFAVINGETVPASVIKKIEEAARLLEQDVVKRDSEVVMDAILSNPQHLLEELNRFYKMKRELL